MKQKETWAGRGLSLCVYLQRPSLLIDPHTLPAGRMNQREPRGGRARFDLLVIHKPVTVSPTSPLLSSPFTSTSKSVHAAVN